MTHVLDAGDLAAAGVVADDVCVMQKGTVVGRGTVDEIFPRARRDRTRHLPDAAARVSIAAGGAVR